MIPSRESIFYEASHPEAILEDHSIADQWYQLPRGSAVIITKGSRANSQERATPPFDLEAFNNGGALPKTLPFKELEVVLRQDPRLHRVIPGDHKNEIRYQSQFDLAG